MQVCLVISELTCLIWYAKVELLVIIIGIVAAIYGKWDWLIWGIFLLCPLMHLFGHDHSGHNHSKGRHS
ncbi:TPA: DUF2933 domain-containing protein, partial [Legionella pneumophila]|nr:DUF2933 domain-containing protein [Legionella pneumophila]